MAKTIEERAEEYTESDFLVSISHSSTIENISNNAYIAGATDQRKIDIEKACEVYRKELTDIKDLFNKLGKDLFNINELGELLSLEGCLKDFKQAMEEE